MMKKNQFYIIIEEKNILILIKKYTNLYYIIVYDRVQYKTIGTGRA